MKIFPIILAPLMALMVQCQRPGGELTDYSDLSQVESGTPWFNARDPEGN